MTPQKIRAIAFSLKQEAGKIFKIYLVVLAEGRQIGDRITNQSNPFTIPSYVRTDAGISYKHDSWRAGLNFKNIFDVKYYDTNGYYAFPQALLTVLGSISVEF